MIGATRGLVQLSQHFGEGQPPRGASLRAAGSRRGPRTLGSELATSGDEAGLRAGCAGALSEVENTADGYQVTVSQSYFHAST